MNPVTQPWLQHSVLNFNIINEHAWVLLRDLLYSQAEIEGGNRGTASRIDKTKFCVSGFRA